MKCSLGVYKNIPPQDEPLTIIVGEYIADAFLEERFDEPMEVSETAFRQQRFVEVGVVSLRYCCT